MTSTRAAGDMLVREFVSRLVNCPDCPPRTVALEQRIKIGTGFHGKWYRSQREHWLGYLGYLFAKQGGAWVDAGGWSARQQWGRMKCFPMLFWVGECAGLDSSTLAVAEDAARDAASLVPHDHGSHGRAARRVLKWPEIEAALRQRIPAADDAVAEAAVLAAYDRLASMKSRYRVRQSLQARG